MSTLLSRITIDPAVCHGKPCIRGLRYPVEMLLDLLSSGMSEAEILADYEDLERDDLQAAVAYGTRIDASWAKESEDRMASYDAGGIQALDAEEVLANETALFSEAALSDWNRPGEDEAWAHLQQAAGVMADMTSSDRE